MNRTLVVVLVIIGVLVTLLLVVFTVADTTAKRAVTTPWPGGLGSLASVPSQFPPRAQSAAATQLVALAAPLGIDFTPAKKWTPPSALQATADYVRQEQASASSAIAPPPDEVARYLAEHATELDAVREHLLRGGTVEWPLDLTQGMQAPIPNLLAHMHLGRVLIARGLATRSWEELHAAWALTQSLRSRPELITQLIALAIARGVNAAAWKLPPPAPPWFAELRATDHERLLARGMQAETWMAWANAKQTRIPFTRLFLGSTLNQQREMVAVLLATHECGFEVGQFFAGQIARLGRWNVFGRIFVPNLASAWRRAFRYRAEREATMNALRIIAGQSIDERSACSDGTWTFVNGTLAFSRELPKGGEQETDMPLALRVRE
ncbi:MAG: hypothetical protein ACLGH0_12430 [Thermoanaerobaculia bacterium]